MPSHSTAEYAVIGLGAAGIATVWKLARAGRTVIGIDKSDVPNDQGSSHGHTRLLRVAYREGEKYVPLVRRAIELWRELERETSAHIFHQTGVFYAGSPGNEFINASLASAQTHNVRLEHNAKGLNNQLTLPGDWSSFTELEGGFVECENSIQCLADQARRAGAKVQTRTHVKAISERNDSVEVETDRGTISARKLVIATGAWSPELLPALAPHLSTERRTLHWFADPTGRYALSAGFKPFIIDAGDGMSFYGFPDIDGRGVKVAEHVSGGDAVNIAQLNRTITAQDTNSIKHLARKYLPDLTGPTHSKVCAYPMTSDGHFIIDRLAGSKRIIVGVGLCGHGFKFAPTLGEAFAGLAQDQPPPIDIGFLSLRRFDAKTF